jgi:site-specific DNA recombinase
MIDIRGEDGGAYVRSSVDKGAGSALEGISVSGQEDEAADCADELGVNLVEVYNDNNLSASKYAKKKRGNWDRMLADIESGRLKVIIMWELSRGSRKFSEWALFLDLIEAKGVAVHAISHSRTYDPSNHKDMEVLQQEGVKAATESNQTSMRVRRGVRKARRLGRPLGMPPFGWTSEYDSKSGKMLTWVTVPREQTVLREMYQRIVSGEAVLTLTRDLARRCDLAEGDPEWVPRSRRGHRWQMASVRTLLLSPTHVGKYWGKDEDGKKTLVQGAWEPAIEEELWWRVRQILTAPERKKTRPGSAKHLLTNIARCSVCDSVMGATRGTGRHLVLRCLGYDQDGSPGSGGGHVSIKMEWIDAYVRDEIVDRMCVGDIVADLTAETSEDQAAAWARAAEIRSDIAEMQELAQSRKIKPRACADFIAEWEPEAKRLEEQANAGLRAGALIVRELLRESKTAGITREELRQVLLRAWEKIPIQGRKDTVRALTKSVTVHPGRRGARAFDPARVEVV